MERPMTPRFAIGDGYAFYEGPSGDGAFHRHAAFQIAGAVRGEVVMVDAAGTSHRAATLLVPPMAWHRLVPAEGLRTFFVEPHCAFADRLRAHCGTGVTPVPEWHGLSEQDVHRAAVRPAEELDPRLLTAMRILGEEQISMPDLAAKAGLSPQHLRALARRQLGMPLTRWRIWRRLRGGVEALRAGRPVAEAAVLGGFADQAHFTRRLREMIGLTPAVVLPLLCPPPPESVSPGKRRTPRSSR
ncbi:AraC family transcriptional regulator [Actinoallomurus spadix]|uniref:AraC family transcriptional regulator n=1 Tax=Actinoallomurus spadix TaxID=79912 RepID=A0ABP3FKV0_9ACTN|nr:AraC family transcriptional regulator [Actinoallomurus spadix]MCO5985708.1 AraC family transcriptional regulator [Actinoallomurus spadix]